MGGLWGELYSELWENLPTKFNIKIRMSYEVIIKTNIQRWIGDKWRVEIVFHWFTPMTNLKFRFSLIYTYDHKPEI